MRLNDFFEKIFCINLDRRADRWAQCLAEFEKYGIEAERFPGSECTVDGKPHGNKGCTLSHRRLLRNIAANEWSRVLVLEDDFRVWIHPGGEPTRAQFEEKLKLATDAVPPDWDMLYIGGHWGSRPQARINANCLKIDTMLTTSSYGITRDFAKVLSDKMEDGARSIDAGNPDDAYLGPIDSVFSGILPHHNCYCIQPRLMIQREGLSDLTGKQENYLYCMTSGTHEAMV